MKFRKNGALKSDGSVVALSGSLCFDAGTVREITSWTGIKKIAIGSNHVAGLKEDGTAVFAGSNNCGQCDIS